MIQRNTNVSLAFRTRLDFKGLCFSRNNGEDDEAADGMEEDERKRSQENARKVSKEKQADTSETKKQSISEEYSRVTGDLYRRNSDSLRQNTPDPEEALSFIGKFKKAVKEHPKPLRNMNTWEPQSF